MIYTATLIKTQPNRYHFWKKKHTEKSIRAINCDYARVSDLIVVCNELIPRLSLISLSWLIFFRTSRFIVNC